MAGPDYLHDQWLVLRCQEGDSAALDELVGRWQERLWRHAWRLTGDEAGAWDAVQEAWLTMSAKLRTLQDPAAFPAWAYQVVTHKSRDWRRAEDRRRGHLAGYREQAPETPEDPVAALDRCRSLQEAMDRLGGQDRAILALHYLDGFSIETIAGVLEIAPGTVKSRLHHARQRLRRLLEASDHD